MRGNYVEGTQERRQSIERSVAYIQSTRERGRAVNRTHMPPPVYLDYNATTPVDEQVLAEMLRWFGEHFGNPSSRRHADGWMADEAGNKARGQIAELLGAEPAGATFTGSATEALNLAIKGVAQARKSHGRHLVTVSTEHNAVLGAHEALEREGFEITRLPVDASGLVDRKSVV